MKLSHKFYLTLVLPLVFVSGLVSAITYVGLGRNSRSLTDALRDQSKSSQALALMLTQDDATKALLIDPNQLEKFSGNKIAAYDEHKKILKELKVEVKSQKMRNIITELEEIDDKELRPIDTKVLEKLFEDIPAAQQMYFKEYDPLRGRYEKLIRELALEGVRAASDANANMQSNNQYSLLKIGLALAFGIIVVSIAIKILSKQVESAQAKIAESFLEISIRSKTISSIYDNLKSGFFLLNRNLQLQDGFTKSCTDILEKPLKTGQYIVDILNLPERDVATFKLLVQQVFDDILPEDMSIGQIPSVFELGQKSIRLEFSVIRQTPNAIESLMVTINDVSAEIAAQAESIKLQSILNIIRSKSGFVSFLEDFCLSIDIAQEALKNKETAKLKMILHTLKGNSGIYGLHGIAKYIHNVESESEITQSQIQCAKNLLEQFLINNYELLRIDFTALNRRETLVTVQDFQKLQNILLDLNHATNRNEAVNGLMWIHKVQYISLNEVFAPLHKSMEILASKMSKQVRFNLVEPNLRIDATHLNPVLKNLVHVYRNAIDHGIEASVDERIGKPEIAEILTTVTEGATDWIIVIRDDGRGIDKEKLVNRAISKGILTVKAAENLSSDEKLRLVFADGLSTADSVTLVSGRGVGMASVLESVNALNGTLKLTSELGLGTQFTIIVPKAMHLELKHKAHSLKTS